MAQFNFGGVMEEVITDEEFPLQKAREVLKEEIVAVLGYGVQGPGQALNMRDNGINVIVGQRKPGASWDRAVADGFVPDKTLFPLVEAAQQATIIQYLLSDAGQMAVWPQIKKCLVIGKHALLLTWLFNCVSRSNPHRSAAGCGCGFGRSQGFGTHRAKELFGWKWYQLKLRHPSGLHRQRQRKNLGLGDCHRIRIPFPHNLCQRSLQRFNR